MVQFTPMEEATGSNARFVILRRPARLRNATGYWGRVRAPRGVGLSLGTNVQ